MTFIISECAINFRDMEEAGEMIKASSDAGADAVKFQFYSPEQVDYHPRREELICQCLTTSRVQFLSYLCEKNSIEFMATPMTPEAVVILAPYVKRWKIRFTDRRNKKIYEAIHDGRLNPILVSCQDPNDTIFNAFEHIGETVIRMWVNPEYPPQQINLPEKFTSFKGFSNHYPDVKVPLMAAEMGAEYIEVHTMLDTYSNGYTPIDANVSIPMSELEILIKKIRKLSK